MVELPINKRDFLYLALLVPGAMPTFAGSNLSAQGGGISVNGFRETMNNIMLDGINVRILNNRLGDAGSDIAELLTGPGEIAHNYVEIASVTGYALGSDTADTVTIANNIVRVLRSGRVSQVVFRFWGGRYRNILSNNQVYADGPSAAVVEMNGYFNVVSGNVFDVKSDQRSRFTVNAGTLVNGNIFLNIDINLKDTTPADRWPIALSNNSLYFTTITPNAAIVVESNNVRTP